MVDTSLLMLVIGEPWVFLHVVRPASRRGSCRFGLSRIAAEWRVVQVRPELPRCEGVMPPIEGNIPEASTIHKHSSSGKEKTAQLA